MIVPKFDHLFWGGGLGNEDTVILAQPPNSLVMYSGIVNVTKVILVLTCKEIAIITDSINIK